MSRKLLEQANELRDLFACMDMEPGSTHGPGPGTNIQVESIWS